MVANLCQKDLKEIDDAQKNKTKWQITKKKNYVLDIKMFKHFGEKFHCHGF